MKEIVDLYGKDVKFLAFIDRSRDRSTQKVALEFLKQQALTKEKEQQDLTRFQHRGFTL